MKAAYIEKTGLVDQITYGDLPKPKATGSQVLVQVKAVSVNPIDTYIRSGASRWTCPSRLSGLRSGRRCRCRWSGGKAVEGRGSRLGEQSGTVGPPGHFCPVRGR